MYGNFSLSVVSRVVVQINIEHLNIAQVSEFSKQRISLLSRALAVVAVFFFQHLQFCSPSVCCRYDRPGVPALRPRVAVEADHREQEGSQGDGGRDRRLLRGHQEAADQGRDLDVAPILARGRPQLMEIAFATGLRTRVPKFPHVQLWRAFSIRLK